MISKLGRLFLDFRVRPQKGGDVAHILQIAPPKELVLDYFDRGLAQGQPLLVRNGNAKSASVAGRCLIDKVFRLRVWLGAHVHEGGGIRGPRAAILGFAAGGNA